MKKLLLTIVLIFAIGALQAQLHKYEPKQGMALEYSVLVMGQELNFVFDIDSLTPHYFSFRYSNAGGRWGKYIMTGASLDSATSVFWGPPHYEEIVTLEGHDVMMVLSKKQWNALQNNSSFFYDGNSYLKKQATGDNQLIVEGNVVDALYFEGENSNARFWVLNNPALPIILRADHNPAGVDVLIEKITLPIAIPQN